MNAILILGIRAYRLLFCRCASPLSCCRKGIAAAELLPFGQALAAVLRISGDCWQEHGSR